MQTPELLLRNRITEEINFLGESLCQTFQFQDRPQTKIRVKTYFCPQLMEGYPILDLLKIPRFWIVEDIIEEPLSTSILFYANFGRDVLGFLTSCHPLWSANLSCQFYLSFPNLRDRALREMKLVALEQELFQHKRNLPKIHLFSLSTKNAHK